MKPKSAEADCEGARKAIRAEIDKMEKRKVWDVDDVHSLYDLLKYPSISEAMLGRAFQMLGVKGDELDAEHQFWKGRIAFQGSNVRTKTGTSAADLYEEISNAPASFAASRLGMGIGALRGFQGSLRDAESACL